MNEDFARVGDIELCFETIGDPTDRPLLLVMGLGMQMVHWDLRFCELLAERGFYVIRFDNRDAGRSTSIQAPVPNVLRGVVGLRVEAPYLLGDMAADARGLLDELGVERAHVVGASMGGMIAQVFAARFRHRTKTLGVIFSSNNQPLLPPPGPVQLRAILAKPKGSSRDAIIDNAVRVSKIIGSPGYPKPDEAIRAEAAEGYERSYYPAGIGRHFAAILGTGSLLRYDRQIQAPTVVIHGKADKLMRPSGGRAVAKAIRNARVVLFDGMGHELPEALWDDIIGELKNNFAEVS